MLAGRFTYFHTHFSPSAFQKADNCGPILRHSLLLVLSLALFISQQLLMAPTRFSLILQEYLKFIIPQLPSEKAFRSSRGDSPVSGGCRGVDIKNQMELAMG